MAQKLSPQSWAAGTLSAIGDRGVARRRYAGTRPACSQPAGCVIVGESAVSSIIDGELAYRGYPIEELVGRASFEEICLLLWNGERPAQAEVERLNAEIAATTLPPAAAAALAAVGPDAPSLPRLEVMITAIAAEE